MIHFKFKQLLWITVLFNRFSTEKCIALSICPTAIWQRNAVMVIGDDASLLRRPTDVYIDNNNSIYVLDSGNYRVQRISFNSTVGTTIINSSNGSDVNQFLSMNAMSIDKHGNIYILDGDNGRVTKWQQGSSNKTVVAGGNGLGNNTNQLNRANGMFIDSNTSTIWIADTNNHRIVQWLSPTNSSVVCGSYGRENNQFMYPTGLFIDTSDSNTLYVADNYNHRIQMWLLGAISGKTVAGITGYYGNGLNQLWYPEAVMVDNNQNMYIVDYWNDRILKWMIGAYSGIIIANGIDLDTESFQFQYPANINFDSSGSLFVTDTYNSRIQKFVCSCHVSTNVSTIIVPSITTPAPNLNTSCSMTTWYSNASTIAGSSLGLPDYTSTSLSHPYDIFIDKNNMLYVLDSSNYRVQRFQSSSTIGTTVINVMSAISVDISGNIYILESENNRVTKWKPGITNGMIVAGGNGNGVSDNQLNNPYGIFIDSKLTIWIADTGNNRIVRWETNSTGIIICGSYGTEANQFNHPTGIFVDENDGNTFYVADNNNHRIQMWSSGAISGKTVAGQTGLCGNQLQQLCNPSSVIADSYRNLYIADTYNNRIMLWMKGSTAGVVIGGGSTFGVLPNQLFYPYNIKLDSDGALIVADTKNNRIQKFSVLCCMFEIFFIISSISLSIFR
ncbi:unnamed protein product [Adineta steineri]|uniref:NHL repeat containing protein n=1 Tax=Adineta steineri TaxID=433720 RepID=A0A814S6E5_9BILA|nr:unnamed protein product [Adineta steineri]CAF1142115.1 unnamed protein product [Adineta steineri]